jgi:hypothetical protein
LAPSIIPRAESSPPSHSKRWILLLLLAILVTFAALAAWGLAHFLTASSAVPDDIAAAARPTPHPSTNPAQPIPESGPKSSTRASPPIGSTNP